MKKHVMLQELVFSISSVRHNMEDNNEEEANEDHRADEPFPGCTENSFYLQYCRIFFFIGYCQHNASHRPCSHLGM